MTIKEYYKNYKKIKFPVHPTCGHSITIDDFYNNCICKAFFPNPNDWFKIALDWHKMLLRYVDLDKKGMNPVLWVRQYESKEDKKAKVFRNRRACFTKFKDGFSYVFVSNFDAQEIFSMISHGVVPDEYTFLSMMEKREFPMHFDPNKAGSCEESTIASYPFLSHPKTGSILKKWYFAHIHDINNKPYKLCDGSLISVKEHTKIFPQGIPSDWKRDKDGLITRKLNYTLTAEEKNIVKAHFLRFVDPLNYFLVPAQKHQSHSISDHLAKTSGKPKQIGEYYKLTTYMAYKYYNNSIIGGSIYADFLKRIMVDSDVASISSTTLGEEIINIDYDPNIDYTSGSSGKTFAITATPKSNMATSYKPNKPGAGTPIRDEIVALLTSGKLSAALIASLKNADYCKKELKMNYPVLVELPGTYDKNRYYSEKKILPCGKYLICNDWYKQKNKDHPQIFEDWKKRNGL